MPRKWAVVEHDGKTYEHTHVHVLMMPTVLDKGKGFYRQTTSFNAFFYSLRNLPGSKHGPHWKPNGPWYYAKRWGVAGDGWDEFDGEMTRLAKTLPDLDDRLLPRTEHSDIWSFYEHIGYDYKKRRYIK